MKNKANILLNYFFLTGYTFINFNTWGTYYDSEKIIRCKNKPETQISKSSLHDVFFRGVFGEKKYSMDIFKLILTPNEFKFFNWRTLKLEANTFINEYLKESRTDLVFSVKPKGSKIETQGVFLMEHKSYADSKVMEQLLKYQAASYLRTPAPILPIIVYHGKNKDYKGPLGFYGNLEKLHNPSIRRSLSKNVLNFRLFTRICGSKGYFLTLDIQTSSLSTSTDITSSVF